MLKPASDPIPQPQLVHIFSLAVDTNYCVVLKECDNTVGVFISPAVTHWIFQWQWMSACAYIDHVISFCKLTRHTKRACVPINHMVAFVPHPQSLCGPDGPRSLCLGPDKSDKEKSFLFPYNIAWLQNCFIGGSFLKAMHVGKAVTMYNHHQPHSHPYYFKSQDSPAILLGNYRLHASEINDRSDYDLGPAYTSAHSQESNVSQESITHRQWEETRSAGRSQTCTTDTVLNKAACNRSKSSENP